LKAKRAVPDETLLQLLERARFSEAEVASRLQNAQDPEYWQKRNPNLSVGLEPSAEGIETASLDSRHRSELLKRFDQEGYFQTQPLLSKSVVEVMREGIEVLRKEQWPPVFALVYDQPWQAIRTPSLVQLLSEILGPGYKQISNAWCHYVFPNKGSSGWYPHMDGYNMPNRLSVWIPLSDATLENGCIYVVPQGCVPETIGDFSKLTNVSRAELQALLQSSRALPAPAGSILGWHFQLIHWGSTPGRAEHPRISMAVEFIAKHAQPTSDEEPLFEGCAALPTFRQRLLVIGKGILEYERFEPTLFRYREFANRLVERVGIARSLTHGRPLPPE
jgi:ectoine hydroxylase-related dioxygenase (phytanoyl-CoA dioxygenase family)